MFTDMNINLRVDLLIKALFFYASFCYKDYYANTITCSWCACMSYFYLFIYFSNKFKSSVLTRWSRIFTSWNFTLIKFLWLTGLANLLAFKSRWKSCLTFFFFFPPFVSVKILPVWNFLLFLFYFFCQKQNYINRNNRKFSFTLAVNSYIFANLTGFSLPRFFFFFFSCDCWHVVLLQLCVLPKQLIYWLNQYSSSSSSSR